MTQACSKRLQRGLRTDLSPQWLDAIDQWQAWLRAAGRSPNTIWLRTYHLRRAAEQLGANPWDVKLVELVSVLDRPSWSAETRKSARAALRSFYGWALDCELIARDLTRKLPRVTVPAGKPRPAPDDVLAHALAAADAAGRLMLMLAAYAGLRRSEIAVVRSDDVVDGSLRVCGKGGRVRVIPLHPLLLAELEQIEGWAFPGRFGGHLSADNVGTRIRRMLGGGYGAHTLRHRFATRAYAAQRDLFAVQQLLGHSRPETTMRYTALPDDALRAAVAAVA